MANTSSSSYCRATRGMPFLHFTPLVALFHSLPTKPNKSRENHLGNRPSKHRVVSNVQDALKVFDEMIQSRPLPPVIPFNKILTQLVKLKQFPAVLSLKRQMGLVGIASDACTLNITINCYCHLNQMEYALSVLAHFFKLGLQPNVATFATLIHGFVLRNRVADAARLFSKMVVGGHCQPDVVTFNTLIKGFCAMENNTAAIQLLGKMEEYGCKPDTVSYNTIIDSLGKHTLVDEALNLFSEMVGRGIVPDVITYNSLIQGVCNIGRWKEAWRLLNEMASQGMHPGRPGKQGS
ncbi:PREDICTED: putative pentatricopeptide repeat-containing protein At1g12700, mitochondrial-like [Fragaria vesca subsp. vesca]